MWSVTRIDVALRVGGREPAGGEVEPPDALWLWGGGRNGQNGAGILSDVALRYLLPREWGPTLHLGACRRDSFFFLPSEATTVVVVGGWR